MDSANPTKRGKLGAGVINPYKALTQCGFSAGPSPSPPIQVRSPPSPPPRRVNSPPPPSPSQSPIASPPPPSGGGGGGGGGSPFTLVPSEPCGLDSRGCVHSPGWPRGYGVSQTCNIRVAPGMTSPTPLPPPRPTCTVLVTLLPYPIPFSAPGTRIRVEQFTVEEGRRGNCVYDFLAVGGQRYCGSNGPPNGSLVTGDRMRWRSDYSITKPGWLICGINEQASPPPAASPPPGECSCPCAKELLGTLIGW